MNKQRKVQAVKIEPMAMDQPASAAVRGEGRPSKAVPRDLSERTEIPGRPVRLSAFQQLPKASPESANSRGEPAQQSTSPVEIKQRPVNMGRESILSTLHKIQSRGDQEAEARRKSELSGQGGWQMGQRPLAEHRMQAVRKSAAGDFLDPRRGALKQARQADIVEVQRQDSADMFEEGAEPTEETEIEQSWAPSRARQSISEDVREHPAQPLVQKKGPARAMLPLPEIVEVPSKSSAAELQSPRHERQANGSSDAAVRHKGSEAIGERVQSRPQNEAAAPPRRSPERNARQSEAQPDRPIVLGRAASRREGPDAVRQRLSEPQEDPDTEREPPEVAAEDLLEEESPGPVFLPGSTGRFVNKKKKGRKQAVEELKAMLHADPRLIRSNMPGGE